MQNVILSLFYDKLTFLSLFIFFNISHKFLIQIFVFNNTFDYLISKFINCRTMVRCRSTSIALNPIPPQNECECFEVTGCKVNIVLKLFDFEFVHNDAWYLLAP